MVNFTILQVVLLTLLAFIKHVDYYGIPMIFVNYAVFWGLITGVVMGDWKTGLVIGGTIQLMQLGVAGFGGSSIPDYGTMAIIATAYGVTLGSDTGLAIRPAGRHARHPARRRRQDSSTACRREVPEVLQRG